MGNTFFIAIPSRHHGKRPALHAVLPDVFQAWNHAVFESRYFSVSNHACPHQKDSGEVGQVHD
jgi:hypothetical protein